MTRRKAEAGCLALALAAWAAMAHAQEGGAAAGRGTTVLPRFSVMETWTDNLRLTAQNKDAALITTVSPGISVFTNTSALRGSLDYSLNGIAYLKSDQPSRVQNSLAANLQAELISRTFFVDVRATIGQQSASAFGLQSVPTAGSQGQVYSLANENQHETATWAVSPALRGALGGLARYELRGDFTRTDVRGTTLGDSRGSGGSLRLDQLHAGVLGWWLQANSQDVESSSTATNSSRALKVGLNYNPDPDWSFTTFVGRERSNYLGGGLTSGTTRGVSAIWSPTVRTRFNADWQRHSYGDSHLLSLEHRLMRSVWRYTDSQTTVIGNTGASGGSRTNYDLYYLLFASLEPDPVKRDAYVRAYLQSVGLSPDGIASGGFLSSGPSRVRSQQLSVTLQGVRASLSGQFGRSVTNRVGSNQNEGDLASTSFVEQRSYSLTASYQLTPTSGLSLIASRQNTKGDASAQSTQLSSLLVNWNARFGSRLSGQLGGRHTRFESVTPYTENAVYASLTQQF